MIQDRDCAPIILPVFIRRAWGIWSTKWVRLISPSRISLLIFLAAVIMPTYAELARYAGIVSCFGWGCTCTAKRTKPPSMAPRARIIIPSG